MKTLDRAVIYVGIWAVVILAAIGVFHAKKSVIEGLQTQQLPLKGFAPPAVHISATVYIITAADDHKCYTFPPSDGTNAEYPEFSLTQVNGLPDQILWQAADSGNHVYTVTFADSPVSTVASNVPIPVSKAGTPGYLFAKKGTYKYVVKDNGNPCGVVGNDTGIQIDK